MSGAKPEASSAGNPQEESLGTAPIALESGAGGSSPSGGNEPNGVAVSVFRKYHRVLQQFLYRRLGSVEDVKEMTQEVYLRIIRYARHTEIRHPRAFLFRTARNLLGDHRRREASRLSDQHVSLDGMDLACPYPAPDEIMESKQVLEEITAVLEALKPQARRAFVLHRFKGLTYAEIAAEMGISKSMVNHHICVVLEKMKEYYGGLD